MEARPKLCNPQNINIRVIVGLMLSFIVRPTELPVSAALAH